MTNSGASVKSVMGENPWSVSCRRGLVVAGLAIGLAATGCGGGGQPPAGGGPGHGGRGGPGRPGGGPGRDAIAVSVAPAAREAISSLYSTSATLRADRRAIVIARTRGVIERLAVEEGDTVETGQALAYLEDDEQGIEAARARTTFETRSREVERLRGLLDQGLVSEDEYEKARRDALDAQHGLELAELELSRTVIRAPFAGVILRRFLDVGATVGDGTEVYELADLSPLYADINVPERHVARLGLGQSVRLTADASGYSVEALIERIAPLVETETGTVKVTVVVEGGARLRPGAFVRVDIVTDTHEEALVVPRSALVAEGRRWYLFRLAESVGEEGQTVERVDVDLGFEGGDRVEIALVVGDGPGLDEGVEVITAGAPALSEGAKVDVVREGEQQPTAEPTQEAEHAS